MASWVSKISSENEEMEKAAVCDRCFIRLSPFVVENILGKFLLFVGQAPHQSGRGDRLTVGGGGAPLIPELHSAQYAYCIVSMGHCFGNILKI